MADGTNRVLRFFPNSDLRCSHDGLRKIAKKFKIEPYELEQGEFLVFANTKQNRIKVYAPGNIVAYLKHDQRIDLDMIRLIPSYFNGQAFDFEGAEKQMLWVKTRKAA